MSDLALINDGKGIQVRIPMKMKRRGGRKEVVISQGLDSSAPHKEDYHEALVVALARAHCFQEIFDSGRYNSLTEMAEALGLCLTYLARLMRLTLLAPDIIEMILDGNEPDGLSLEQLRRPMPMMWEAQRVKLTKD